MGFIKWLRDQPVPFRAFLRSCYHWIFRTSLPLRFWIVDNLGRGGPNLPPARLRFRVTESLDTQVYAKTSIATAQRLAEMLAESGRPVESFLSILDFGCGCGRTMSNIPFRGKEFWGVDIDPDSVEWCNANIPNIRCKVTEPLPPLDFTDGQFDLIYAISVFTHLDFKFQCAWRDELFRILAPGGLLLFSIHGESISKDRISEGGIAYMASEKLHGILPEWYQTTYQTRDSVYEVFGSKFETITFVAGGMGAQDVYLAYKHQPN